MLANLPFEPVVAPVMPTVDTSPYFLSYPYSCPNYKDHYRAAFISRQNNNTDINALQDISGLVRDQEIQMKMYQKKKNEERDSGCIII